jgi:transposase
LGTYKYPAEFRADAVALYRASPERPVAAVARDLGVNHETLRLWIKAAEESETPSVRAEADKGAEIAVLRRQVRELELAGEILRRAAKFFAGETNW